MAAPDVDKVQGTAGTVTFAGTAIGVLHDIHLVPIQRLFPNTAEEYGGLTVEEYEMGRDWVLTGTARGKDADMLDAIFEASSGGSIAETLSNNKGKALSARSGSLVFTPRDTALTGFTLHRALPRVRETTRIPFSVHDRVSFAVVFCAIPDSSGDIITWGL